MVTALLLPSPARFLLVGKMLTAGAEHGEVLHQLGAAVYLAQLEEQSQGVPSPAWGHQSLK